MRSKTWQIVCTLLVVLVVPATTTRAEPLRRLMPRRARQVNQIVDAQMQAQQIVGLAVGLIEGGEIVYLKGYGLADREEHVPVSRATLFRWASISKPVTAVAAMQLWEQGKLDLNADVRSYVPEFPDQGALITPRHLLGHLGGIVHYRNGKLIRTSRVYERAHPYEDVILALDTFKESPLVAAPGEKYSYTTHGFILLSAVVQRAGGASYWHQVRDRIAKPLAMTTFQPDYQWKDIPHRAVGYRKRLGKVVRSTDTDVSWKLGGGGYVSNIDDLTRFAQGLLAGKLVGKSAERLMWTPQRTSDGEVTRYGLGLTVRGDGDDLRIGHGGSQEKTKTFMVVRPRRGTGVAVMCNSEYANPSTVALALAAALHPQNKPAPGQ